jgi:4-carboxymuconolactone decarboxylase
MSSNDAKTSHADDLDAALKHIGVSPLAPEELHRLAEPYHKLIGYLPPRVAARHRITAAIDRRVVTMQEELRSHVMAPACFDDKTTQLLAFAMLMMDLSDAAKMHAVAARRCGATWEELQAVVSLCFLFRGIPAANRGAALLMELMLLDPSSRKAEVLNSVESRAPAALQY